MKEIVCKICKGKFIFTDGEAQFYKDRGLEEPKRCPECRAKKQLISVKPNIVCEEPIKKIEIQ